MRPFFAILLFLIFLQSTDCVFGQELEPRSLTNVPVGTNFALLGYGYGRGDILMDPAIPIEGLNARINTFVGAYVRSFSLLGLSSKLDVVVPFGFGDWTGRLSGVDTATSRTGFGDVRVRLSMNMLGAPALNGSQFVDYEQKTIVGLNLQLILPVGQYNPDKLINLGSHRLTYRPQVGVSHKTGKWILEAYGSIWIFSDNGNFFGGNRLAQDALIALKLHAIRSLPRGMWVAGGIGYGIGGRTELNGEPRDTRISALRLGLAYVCPINRHHALKLTVDSGIRFERGPDFDAIGIVYQYVWGGKGADDQ
jgi:hypothetical protein